MKGIILVMVVFFSNSALANSIVSENVLREWGYKSLNKTLYMASYCEGPSGAKNVSYQSIKSLSSLKGHSNTYYRFTLAKEEYNSAKLVSARLNELASPARRSSKHSKLCNIRKSFPIGHKVYFVHTDAGMFVSELGRVIELFRINAKKP